MKKVLSILLCMTLMAAILAVPASAVTNDETIDGGYYIVFKQDNYKLSESNRLHGAGNYYWLGGLSMNPSTAFRIAYSLDLKEITAIYPKSEDNDYVPRYSTSFYTVEFTPGGNNGGDSSDTGWYDGYVRAFPCEPPLEEPPEDASIEDQLAYYVYKIYGAYYPSDLPEIFSYEELYTHTDISGDTDWALIYAEIGGAEPWMGFGIIGNRVMLMGPLTVFTFGMAVYDAKEHTFYDLAKMDDYSAYDGLAEAIDTCGKGRLLGDLDLDDVISVIDATIMQRCEARIMEYPESDSVDAYEYIDSIFHPLQYYSDFNRDGSRDITDATCIQRYLVNAPYPKYR